MYNSQFTAVQLYANRPLHCFPRRGARADGRHHRQTIPYAGTAIRRRMDGGRDDQQQPRSAKHAQNSQPHRPQRRKRRDCRADCRQQPGSNGRSRPLQRGTGCAAHRHQYGLPGQESVPGAGWQRPAAKRALGGRNFTCRSARGGCAGYAQNKAGLARRTQKHPHRCPHGRRRRHCRHRHPRPHPHPNVSRPG